MQLCEYGCGQEAKHQFKNGKWCCGEKIQSCPIIGMKISRSNKGNVLSEDHKKKISETKKGSIPWNLGKFHTEETKKKISISKKGKSCNKGIVRSKKTKEKISKSMKFNLSNYKEKYPFFSKIEEMRHNPDKPDEKEIQVHCKNHECENSKEKGGWFTPTYIQLYERIRALEKPHGMIENNFYCCQICKHTCFIYNVKGDPYKKNILPYSYKELQLWRQIVLKEDKGLCQYCGKPATDVHHIKPVKTHPYLALDPDNGISFCEECHYKIGHKTGTECSTGNLANKQQDYVLGGQI